MASGLSYKQVVINFGDRNFQKEDAGSQAECSG